MLVDNAPAILEAIKTGRSPASSSSAAATAPSPDETTTSDFARQTPETFGHPDAGLRQVPHPRLCDYGTVACFPRLLDMGQCNDAYGAIQVAVALAEALGCGVN